MLMVSWAAALMLIQPESAAVTREIPAKIVSVWRVTEGDLHPVDEVTGMVIPAKRSALYFQSGGTVVERLVQPGQPVTKGELLLRIDDTVQTSALMRAEARLANERKTLTWDRKLAQIAEKKTRLLKREVQRQEQLLEKSLASEADLDKARNAWLTQQTEQTRLTYKVQTADERLRILAAERDQARHRLRQRLLSAPYSGVINQVMAEVGEWTDSRRAALELVTTDQLELEISVTGRLLQHVQVGMPITVTAGGRTVSGFVNALQPSPDAMTHTHSVRIALPPDERLTIGLTGRAQLPAPPLTNVPLVPESAVFNEEGQHYVYSVDDTSRLQRVPVDVLAKTGEHIAVRHIRPGQYIVLRNVDALDHGEEVQIRMDGGGQPEQEATTPPTPSL